MKPIRTIRTAILLMLAWSSAVLAGCRARNDRRGDAGSANLPGHVVLYDVLCRGQTDCERIYYDRPEQLFGASIGITDCDDTPEDATLVGSWSVEDATSGRFEWQALAPPGGVFPSLGHLGASIGCGNLHRQVRSPMVIVALDPDGFAWAKLEDGDLFIPLYGKATVDHDFHATATLDAPQSPSAPRATVYVDAPGASPTVFGNLGPGDGFSWGEHRATVVRVVAPGGGNLGAIGWVEVHLTDGVAPPGGP